MVTTTREKSSVGRCAIPIDTIGITCPGRIAFRLYDPRKHFHYDLVKGINRKGVEAMEVRVPSTEEPLAG